MHLPLFDGFIEGSQDSPNLNLTVASGNLDHFAKEAIARPPAWFKRQNVIFFERLLV